MYIHTYVCKCTSICEKNHKSCYLDIYSWMHLDIWQLSIHPRCPGPCLLSVALADDARDHQSFMTSTNGLRVALEWWVSSQSRPFRWSKTCIFFIYFLITWIFDNLPITFYLKLLFKLYLKLKKESLGLKWPLYLSGYPGSTCTVGKNTNASPGHENQRWSLESPPESARVDDHPLGDQHTLGLWQRPPSIKQLTKQPTIPMVHQLVAV